MRRAGSRMPAANASALLDRINASFASAGKTLQRYFAGSRMHPGVERAISHSSSFMSADTSANSGVLR